MTKAVQELQSLTSDWLGLRGKRDELVDRLSDLATFIWTASLAAAHMNQLRCRQ